MSAWLLLPISLATLYVVWEMLDLVSSLVQSCTPRLDVGSALSEEDAVSVTTDSGG